MNKKMKSLILGATMIMALPIIGGCGSNTIGYVDSQKVVTQTAKSIEINKEINAKGNDIIHGCLVMRGEHIDGSYSGRCVSECRGRGCLPTGTGGCDSGQDVELGNPWCDIESKL